MNELDQLFEEAKQRLIDLDDPNSELRKQADTLGISIEALKDEIRNAYKVVGGRMLVPPVDWGGW